MNLYDEDYYERGTATGRSCYDDYRWLPGYTLSMVYSIIEHLAMPRGARVLDYGAAKGFVVRALRAFGMHAVGCDVSPYALDHCDPRAAGYLRLSTTDAPVPWAGPFDYVIAKDVLEHMPPDEILRLLRTLAVRAPHTGTVLFVAVPLAVSSGGPYVSPGPERDHTHVVRETLEGWTRVLTVARWTCVDACHRVPGVGEHHTAIQDCVGFLTLTCSGGGVVPA